MNLTWDDITVPTKPESLYVELRIEDFVIKPSEKGGESDVIGVRIPAGVSRDLDILITTLRERGFPIKVRSDYLRWALQFSMTVLVDYLQKVGKEDSNLLKSILLSKEVNQQEYNLSRSAEVATNVKKTINSLARMVHYNDYQTLSNTLEEWLGNIFKYAGVDDYMFLVYLHEIGRHPNYKQIIKELKDKNLYSAIMSNFDKAYENKVVNAPQHKVDTSQVEMEDVHD